MSKDKTVLYAMFSPWPVDNLVTLKCPRLSIEAKIQLLGVAGNLQVRTDKLYTNVVRAFSNEQNNHLITIRNCTKRRTKTSFVITYFLMNPYIFLVCKSLGYSANVNFSSQGL